MYWVPKKNVSSALMIRKIAVLVINAAETQYVWRLPKNVVRARKRMVSAPLEEMIVAQLRGLCVSKEGYASFAA